MIFFFFNFLFNKNNFLMIININSEYVALCLLVLIAYPLVGTILYTISMLVRQVYLRSIGKTTKEYLTGKN